MSKQPFLSIVIPLFNESKRIYNLTAVLNYLKTKKFSFEIIVVNDGSTDDSKDRINKLNNKSFFKILSYETNKGKGYAIKKGVLAAKGDFILFTDIDLSTPINELDKFLPLTKSYEVIIGTRKTFGSNVMTRQSPIRETLGKIFTFLSQLILSLEVSDFTCGFKLFSKKASKEIFSRLTINRWGFDSEILFIAYKKGYRIEEVGVSWKNDPLTKVKFPQDAINSLIELFKIRINDLRGLYN